MTYRFKDEEELRAGFWADHPRLRRRITAYGTIARQNQQPADTRAAFVDYVDSLARSGAISDELAQSVTL